MPNLADIRKRLNAWLQSFAQDKPAAGPSTQALREKLLSDPLTKRSPAARSPEETEEPAPPAAETQSGSAPAVEPLEPSAPQTAELPSETPPALTKEEGTEPQEPGPPSETPLPSGPPAETAKEESIPAPQTPPPTETAPTPEPAQTAPQKDAAPAQPSAEPAPASPETSATKQPVTGTFQLPPRLEAVCNRVFITRGADPKMTDHLLQFLKDLRIQTYISEPGSELRSLDQKFIQIKDIGFAVVILSHDEFVYPKDKKPADAKLRASQQTIFELGYLLGRLGRQRVFVLYTEQKSFLLPTAYFEAVYTPFDREGHWKKELLKRLQTNGFLIDEKK